MRIKPAWRMRPCLRGDEKEKRITESTEEKREHGVLVGFEVGGVVR